MDYDQALQWRDERDEALAECERLDAENAALRSRIAALEGVITE